MKSTQSISCSVAARLRRVIEEAGRLGMVVIVGYFRCAVGASRFTEMGERRQRTDPGDN
jgi:hypothetical protein